MARLLPHLATLPAIVALAFAGAAFGQATSQTGAPMGTPGGDGPPGGLTGGVTGPTQSMAEPMYGSVGLDLLQGGFTAQEVLTALSSVDPQPERRQVLRSEGRRRIRAGFRPVFPRIGAVPRVVLEHEVAAEVGEAIEKRPALRHERGRGRNGTGSDAGGRQRRRPDEGAPGKRQTPVTQPRDR